MTEKRINFAGHEVNTYIFFASCALDGSMTFQFPTDVDYSELELRTISPIRTRTRKSGPSSRISEKNSTYIIGWNVTRNTEDFKWFVVMGKLLKLSQLVLRLQKKILIPNEANSSWRLFNSGLTLQSSFPYGTWTWLQIYLYLQLPIH